MTSDKGSRPSAQTADSPSSTVAGLKGWRVPRPARGETREGWLRRSVEAFRPYLAAAGSPIPETVHISTGFPSHRALSAKKRVVAQCWSGEASEDGNPHVFVSPLEARTTEILDHVLHELIHAAGINGHGSDFRGPALALGLSGKDDVHRCRRSPQGHAGEPGGGPWPVSASCPGQ